MSDGYSAISEARGQNGILRHILCGERPANSLGYGSSTDISRLPSTSAWHLSICADGAAMPTTMVLSWHSGRGALPRYAYRESAHLPDQARERVARRFYRRPEIISTLLMLLEIRHFRITAIFRWRRNIMRKLVFLGLLPAYGNGLSFALVDETHAERFNFIQARRLIVEDSRQQK